MSTIKVDAIATRTGSGNITLSNDTVFSGDLTVDTNTLVVDSTNNHVFIKKTSAAYQTVGHELKSDGRAFHTSSGGKALSLVRNTSNGAIMDFYNSGGTEVGSIETAASGIGIKLGGTASANLLDDYEEGTFTPAITGLTLSTALGHYTKIGNVVHWGVQLGIPSTSASTHFKINNPPFTNATNQFGGALIYANHNVTNNVTVIVVSNEIQFYKNGSSFVTYADYSGKDVRASGSYLTSS